MRSNDTTAWKPCFKMLKSLADGTTFPKFVLIKDNENCSGLDIFKSFLANHATNKSVKKINLICYEYPPNYYLPKDTEKIIHYNYFSDPLNWNNESGPKTDLSAFTLNPQDHSDTVFFIDSLSCLIIYHKFYPVYKNLSQLKKSAMQVIALIHGDLFIPEEAEELDTLPNTIVELHQCECLKGVIEKTVIVTHKKINGKVAKQTEVVTINEDMKMSIRKKMEKKSSKGAGDVTGTIQSLATFKLGFDMSENEKRARDKLVLPYIRTETKSSGGEIIYQPEPDELEEDPDDDLDI